MNQIGNLMTKHSKALAKLSATPPPSNVKWDELKGLLEHLGYKVLNGSGSRRKFFHKEKDDLIICHEPHPSPDVDKGCVCDVVDHLRAMGFI
jgi:predicted RNA binding protein YcfA (HicA-like mRNA interferase family)